LFNGDEYWRVLASAGGEKPWLSRVRWSHRASRGLGCLVFGRRYAISGVTRTDNVNLLFLPAALFLSAALFLPAALFRAIRQASARLTSISADHKGQLVGILDEFIH
jgi:hypothetical protein